MARLFDPHKVLRQISNSLLREFFDGKGGLKDVSWEGLGETQITSIFKAWQELSDENRKEVQVVLQQINVLADERGARALADEIKRLAPERLVEFADCEGRMDKAMWASLHVPEAFEKAALFARADALAAGRFWVKRNGLPRQPLRVVQQTHLVIELSNKIGPLPVPPLRLVPSSYRRSLCPYVPIHLRRTDIRFFALLTVTCLSVTSPHRSATMVPDATALPSAGAVFLQKNTSPGLGLNRFK